MLKGLFHPIIASWFKLRFKTPTEVQSLSWPKVAENRHLLITAPTGSGKTLTAFLWAINEFAAGNLDTDTTRILYISPLKALNNDIQRNLLAPLSELKTHFDAAGVYFPDIRVQIRSGDTPQSERQRMLRKPPAILITTPESLSLMLTNQRARQALSGIQTVIFDEIHSIADNRRGVQLMLCAERLAHITGEFQRIALSATIRPLKLIANFVAGFDEQGHTRPISIVESTADKKLEFKVLFPEAAKAARTQAVKVWEPLTASFLDHIHRNTSTLFFTNNRALAEKITLKLNAGEPEPLAYAHHGSLAREIRTEVEHRLKAGELKAIVATSSLEMGIDVGALDEVVLIQSPPSIASTIQRIGRAGHGVGETSKGALYPTHPQDFVEAAALSKAVNSRDIEAIEPLENSLDVLAQSIVSMTATEVWDKDALFSVLIRSFPYKNLEPELFNLVVEMLAGRYQQSRIRSLKPRVHFDRTRNTLEANRAALFALYNSGGTIPDRGYYKLRHVDSGAMIGELDEEFVWEARVGQHFALGTQHWRIQRITHNDVLVTPSKSKSTPPPFWKAENLNRNFHLSNRIGEFLQDSESLLQDDAANTLIENLISTHGFEASAANELTRYLCEQRNKTGAPLPHRRHLLLEHINTGPGGYGAQAHSDNQSAHSEQQLVLHTLWGGKLNQPYALALASAFEQHFGERADIYADNNAIVLQLKHSLDPETCLSLVTADNLDGLLRDGLENSGFFGARFRECAGRSLLLTRQKFNQRLPLWMSRMQAKSLMEEVKQYADFPILLETWRTCLKDEFDLVQLKSILEELRSGAISTSYIVSNSPSPFAANISWNQIDSQYMYADDTPQSQGASSLTDELLRSAAFGQASQIRLSRRIIRDFETKRQRLWPGYAPRSIRDLEEWVKERICLPKTEWQALTTHLDFEPKSSNLRHLKSQTSSWQLHSETARPLTKMWQLNEPQWTIEPAEFPLLSDSRDASALLAEFLSFYGPFKISEIAARLPLAENDLLVLINELVDRGTLVSGFWTQVESIDSPQQNADLEFCDAINFDSLLRLERASKRAGITAKPLNQLPGFLASWQSFAVEGTGLTTYIDKLSGVRAPVDSWLHDFLHSRSTLNIEHELELLARDSELVWVGSGKHQVFMAWASELDIVCETNHREVDEVKLAKILFKDPRAQYAYTQLHDASQLSAQEFNTVFWQWVWQGAISANNFATLAKASAMHFKLGSEELPGLNSRSKKTAQHHRRAQARRIRTLALGWPGQWRLLAREKYEVPITDPLTQMEQDKDRVRLLLDRYGVLCRELLNREGPPFSWSKLFRCMRLMELSGEIIGGLFFEGLSGPQFATPAALRSLSHAKDPVSFWISALDPISPCGLGLDWVLAGQTIKLPQRRQGNYLAFAAGSLILSAEKYGARLHFFVPPEDAKLQDSFDLLEHLLRQRTRIRLDLINQVDAKASPYLEILGNRFDLSHDHISVDLSAKL